MRRASALLVIAAACSTSSARSLVSDAGRAAPAPSPAARAAPDTGAQKMIHVAAFDCEKHEVFPGLPAPKGPVASTNGVRSWHGGGPGGANWNVEDLRCTVRATTTCARGNVDLVLRVGTSVVAEKRAAVAEGPVDFEVPVPMKAWKTRLDQPSKKVTASLPYKTAAFRALAVLDCAAPSEVSLKNSGYADVTDEDSFVAGFASGE